MTPPLNPHIKASIPDSATEQLANLICAAKESQTPLRIRGGGTKNFYGQAVHGALLDTKGLQGICSYEPSELVVTVRAGTALSELEALLATQGQCLPFEPPHFGAAATVGGMVAAGLSGPARACVGSVRDYVLGVSMINGRGEFLTFGGQVMKNVAGYDVSRLLAGSLGVLGVITEVSLKVLPLAAAEVTLRMSMHEATALRKLNLWCGQPLPLNASLWVNDPQWGPCLYLRLRGAAAAVATASERFAKDEAAQQLDESQALSLWQNCREQRLPWFSQHLHEDTSLNSTVSVGKDLWRLSVPQTSTPLALDDTLIEWHGGLRWVWLDAADVPAATHLRELVARAGGSATLFKAGAAQSKSLIPVFDALSLPIERIHRDLKSQFDPAGIFNPSRLLASP